MVVNKSKEDQLILNNKSLSKDKSKAKKTGVLRPISAKNVNHPNAKHEFDK